MSSPVVGYATMPIVPSLKGLDAEINRQLSGGTLERSATLAGQKTGTAFNRGFATNSGVAEAGRAAGDQYSTGFAAQIAATGAATAFGRTLREGSEQAAVAGAEYATEFSAAVTSQLLSLPKAQADRLAEQLRADAAKQQAAGAAASRSFLDGFNEGLSRSRADLDAIGIDESSLTSFGLKAVAVGGIAAFGLTKATKAAGDLNAAIAASQQVFGGSASEIQSWSDDSADSFGLSQRAAIEAATGFAVFGNAAKLTESEIVPFSTGLVELAADMAAFANTTPDEAVTAISAALRGEFDPIEKYGVLLNELTLKEKARALGIYEGSGALTSQQKVLAANAVIMEDTLHLQDQFTREQGEAAQQAAIMSANWENAQAALGDSLLPALTGAAKATNELLQGFQRLSPATQETVAKLGLAGSGATVLVGGLSLAAGAALRLTDAYGRVKNAAAAQNAVVATSAKAATVAVKGLGAALLAVTAIEIGDSIRSGLAGEADRLDSAAKELQATLGETTDPEAILAAFSERAGAVPDSIWSEIPQVFGKNLEIMPGMARETIEDIQTAFESLTLPEQGGVIDALQRYGATLDAGSQAARDNADLLDNLTGRYDLNARASTAAAAATGDVAGAADSAAGSTDALADAQKQLDAATNSLTRKQTLLGFQFESNAAAAQGYLSAVERSGSTNALVRAGVGVASALRQVRDGLTGESAAADAAEESTDSLSVALERMNDALEWGNPQLSMAAIELGAFKAAADGFRNSMENSSGLRNQVSAAIGLGEAYRDFSMVARRLPGEIDMVALTLGEYRPRTVEAIQATLALGSAFSDYLGSLLEAGRGTEYVRSEANRFRGELAAQLRQAGLTEAQVESYLQVLNATPEAVETAIRVSGEDAARFKIQSLLQLLEGRIPESVALSVTNAISTGDLEGAARQLQQVAASNPVKIPLEVDSATVADAEAELLRLPPTIDLATAALGGYTEEQERGIEAMLGLGDAAQEFISKLVGEGRNQEALDFAAGLRGQVYDLAIQMGATDEGARDLLETLGLEGWQVEAGITLAGFDRTVFEITTLLGLLDGELSPEQAREIRLALATGDLERAGELIRGEVLNIEQRERIDLRVEALTDPATGQIDIWRVQTENGVFPVIGVDANTGLAYEDVDEFRRWAASQPALVQVDADTRLAQEKLRATFGGALIALLPGGVDGDPRTPYRDGGLVTGPGTGRSDSIAAWLSNGEFVIPELRVRQYGLDFLEGIRAGRLDSKAKTPAGLTLHSGPRIDVGRWDSLAAVPEHSGGGEPRQVHFHQHPVLTRERQPSAHEQIADWNSAIHRGDIRWPE